jgi:hypothetical protein
VKPDDAWEVNDVADRCPDAAQAMYELMSQLRQQRVEACQIVLPPILTQPFA